MRQHNMWCVYVRSVWRGMPDSQSSTPVLCTHASQVIICSHNIDNVLYELYVSTLNQVCNFSQVMAVAP